MRVKAQIEICSTSTCCALDGCLPTVPQGATCAHFVAATAADHIGLRVAIANRVDGARRRQQCQHEYEQRARASFEYGDLFQNKKLRKQEENEDGNIKHWSTVKYVHRQRIRYLSKSRQRT